MELNHKHACVQQVLLDIVATMIVVFIVAVVVAVKENIELVTEFAL
ncbi:hypothetical protein HMPREF0077_0725 [Anaerococcus tetradius ATCC 35098]|uniref:Uncharacterized protein n=1 Tax=Anaerococcus tetradius ATCC 35098 TaxID=525255 RepID=C2CGW5_9FIRM|nr:hypothetical protein HMPREF0077_0725 [Anaerococcus tetradius ATCC 35098]